MYLKKTLLILLLPTFLLGQSKLSNFISDDFQNSKNSWKSISTKELNDNFNLPANTYSGNLVFFSEKESQALATRSNYGNIFLKFDFLQDQNGEMQLKLLDLIHIKFKSGPSLENGKVEIENSRSQEPINEVWSSPLLWQKVELSITTSSSKGNFGIIEFVKINNILVLENVIFQSKLKEGIVELENLKGKTAIKNFQYNLLDKLSLEVEEAQKTAVKKKATKFAPGIYINEIESRPKIIRSFMNFEDSKKTRIISVGSSNKTHYAFNLENGSLLKSWRGGFADLTQLWYERSQNQILIPLGNEIVFSDRNKFLGSNSTIFKSYNLNKEGYPVYSFTVDNKTITEYITPLENGISITINGYDKEYVLGKNTQIVQIKENVFLLDNYLIKVSSDLNINIKEEGNSMMLIAENAKNLTFQIIW